MLFIAKQTAKALLQKTTISTLGALLIVVGVIVGQNVLTTPDTSHAATPVDSCFNFNAGTGTITAYYNNEGGNGANPACPKQVDIPATIGGVPVTSIGMFAFNSKQLTSVTLPSSVATIQYSAFSNNELTSITLPSSVTTIGAWSFSSNKLTSLTIPSNVTTIEGAAFINNSLSTLSIPDTVTSLGVYAFEANQLTSLTLGCGVSSLTGELFAINKLQEVTIPDCVTSVDSTTFFGQNPWGGVVDWDTDPAHSWYSSDPAIVQNIRDNIWYVRLRTSNPNNPNSLVDGITDEVWYTGDLNNDGDEFDSIGGHLINPASVSVRYVDDSNADLSTSHVSTGRLGGSTDLTGYLIKDIQTPQFADAQSPTAEEQTALEASFAPYYRIGQNVSFTAPTISGYAVQTPTSPHILPLTDLDNSLTFTYAVARTEVTTPPPSQPTTPAPSTPVVNSTTESATTKPGTRSAAVTPSTATTENNDNESSTTPVETRTKVDFTTQSGSTTNPTAGSVPSGLAPIIAKSSLAIDETKSCNQIDSAKLISGASFKAPNSSDKTLGGLAFALGCQTAGGDAKITFTLGDTVSDLSKVKVYKQDATGIARNITNQVILSNQTIDGRTTISYVIKDGESLDDDGKANGSISDPIYIVTPGDTATPLAAKGESRWGIITLTSVAVIVVGIITAIVVYEKRRA